jgi:hypothetical protein
MKTSPERRRTIAAGIAATFATTGSVAWAHGGIEEEDRPTRESAPAPAQPRTAGTASEGAGSESQPPHAESANPPGRTAERGERAAGGLDLVLGWGRVPFAVQNLPSTGQSAVTYTRSADVNSNVQSLIVGGSVPLAERFRVGMRLPLAFAGFFPVGSASRSTTALGNLELEGEYTTPLNARLRLVTSLGAALPTAQGTEIPDDLDQTPASAVDSTSLDRFSLNRAAASARGYEDNALFEPNRFGVVPKIALECRFGGLSVDPYAKVENLVGTSSTLAARYVGEIVVAVRVGYRVERMFALTLKGVLNVGFAGSADDKRVAAAVEPAAMFHLGPIRPYAGVIVPVAGQPFDAGFFGVRLGLEAEL